MEISDHSYTSITYDTVNPSEFTYKMRPNEVEDFVKLRVTNNHLFSGRRNTSMWAWRAILKHMGLQNKMTHSQASKKWENMKKKYKELKNPSEGVKVLPEAWPYFSLMNRAMEGRLESDVPILKVFPTNDAFPSRHRKRKASMVMNSPSLAGGYEIDVSLKGDEDEQEVVEEADRIIQEMENGRDMMYSERQVMEKEKEVMERERLVLQRERAALDREAAALDRDRASLERERATIEREKAVMERERATIEREKAVMERERATIEREKAVMERERAAVEKDRDIVSRNWLVLEREKTKLERLPALKERTEDGTEDGGKAKDVGVTDRKELFFSLFPKTH